MAYRDFSLKRVKQKLGVTLTEGQQIFSAIESMEIYKDGRPRCIN